MTWHQNWLFGNAPMGRRATHAQRMAYPFHSVEEVISKTYEWGKRAGAKVSAQNKPAIRKAHAEWRAYRAANPLTGATETAHRQADVMFARLTRLWRLADHVSLNATLKEAHASLYRGNAARGRAARGWAPPITGPSGHEVRIMDEGDGSFRAFFGRVQPTGYGSNEFIISRGFPSKSYKTQAGIERAAKRYFKAVGGRNVRGRRGTMPASMQQVTIYAAGPMGAITKTEGRLESVHLTDAQPDAGSITYVPKGGRKGRWLSTYYAPYILVVPGWRRPNPPSGWRPARSAGPGVSVQRGKYRSADPRWVQDFEAAVRGKLPPPLVAFQSGTPALVGKL